MENPFETTSINTKSPRSTLLTVLCILTFIGSGFMFICTLSIGIFFDPIIAILTNSEYPEMYAEMMEQSINLMQNAGQGFYFSSGILYAMSVIGAAMMFSRNKLGFHIYTIAQILLLLIPIPFKIATGFPVMGVLWTALFVILYYLEMRKIQTITIESEDYNG